MGLYNNCLAIMSEDRESPPLKPEAPALIKQLRWVQLYWRTHWKLLVIGALILCAIPIYDFAKNQYAAIQYERSKPKSLGTFEIKIENHSSYILTVSNVAEFYLQAPKTPGMNAEVSSGLIQLDLPNYQLTVAPHDVVSITGQLLNEQRLLPYLDAGEYFGLIIFSASPKPIRTEIVFNRENFRRGILFVVEG